MDDDPDVWVIIITGSGERAFCTGQDLKDVAKEGPEAWRGSYSVESPPGMPNMYEMYTGTPAIAAINGFCIAGGLEDCAQLRHKGCGRACAVRPAGSAVGNHSQRWGDRQAAEAMPMCIAIEMLLTGGRIDAQEAHRTGLINRVVAADQVMSTAEEIAEKICRNGPLAVRAIKESVQRGYNLTLPQAFQFEKVFSTLLGTTEDAIEGPLAFSEKRQPEFKGR